MFYLVFYLDRVASCLIDFYVNMGLSSIVFVTAYVPVRRTSNFSKL